MVGNLVDNACKWAQLAGRASRSLAEPAAADGKPRVRIIVDDDGPGPVAGASASGSRSAAQRLDETKPGSGLGLSIVVELAAPLWRRAHARHRADRGVARRAGAAGGVRAVAFNQD